MPLPFFTIGHSNRSIEAFIGMLRHWQIEMLVDVRKFAMSRANPQFNEQALSETLAGFQISYERNEALGGRRGRVARIAPEVNGMWENKSFLNYADYALSDEFHEGLERLIAEGRARRCAIMCAEAVWWRCHRRLIADNLIAQGEEVFNIMGEDRAEPARLTPGAVVQPDKRVVYPT
ncbi:DUF488 domain-containing protein [Paracoccus suum]|uniref:DUF488 domain-containing protein n=1 Tax=Paracoccus suum TaxID=2259340 RepID=A0A344PJ02_9RHOB|nr:DUF488 domain-containing protein [Paracoccus suum]AXC49357.1 DUF488 domain-containing protein [Paracoccus suum]